MERESGINSKERLCALRSDLEAEYSSGTPDWEKINFLKSEVAKAFRDEEEYWRQKSKDKWLVAGDNNTSCLCLCERLETEEPTAETG